MSIRKSVNSYLYKQISLPIETSEKMKTLSSKFKYKKLTRGKIINEMLWQYKIIENTNRAIVFRNGKFEVIEND
jgi:hypothetical protein